MAIILRPGDRGEEVVLLQKAINELGGFNLSMDGDYGNGTQSSLMAVQRKLGAEPSGYYNSDQMPEIKALVDNKYIRFEEIEQYAVEIGVEPAFLKAVREVESRGSGFFNNGQCAILFERHIFFNQVTRKFGRKRAEEWMQKYPNICHHTPMQSAYFGGIREYDRLNTAKNLDPECALLSASWGMFQIMGFNYQMCGYQTVGDYVDDMLTSEKFHLGSVTLLIRNQPSWWRAAIDLNFNEFARLYNGPSYAKHNYHTRLRNAFDKYAMA